MQISSTKSGLKPGTEKSDNGSDSEDDIFKSSDIDRGSFRIYLWIIFPIVSIVFCVIVGLYYDGDTDVNNQYLLNKTVSPLNISTLVASSLGSQEDIPQTSLSETFPHKMFWGTYRANLYFGFKTRSPKSPVIGLMWTEITRLNNKGRHWCNKADDILKYGWVKHDGMNFGIQEIYEKNFNLTTSFVKRSGGRHGGDWSARVSAVSTGKSGIMVSFFTYLALDKDGHIMPKLKRNRIVMIDGYIKELGDFRLKFPEASHSPKVKYSYLIKDTVELTDITNLISKNMFYVDWNITHKYSSLNGKYNLSDAFRPTVIVCQITAMLPIQFEIIYKSGSFRNSPNKLQNDVFTKELNKYSNKFEKRFGQVFQLDKKGYNENEIAFAKAAISNLLGEISYFYGSSLVKSKYKEEPVKYWSTGLYTSIPSRSFFPRGFLWNVGFDNLLISLWNNEISEDIICHWLDLQNIEGWIPREQILGEEAKERVPKEFIVQDNEHANPPTIFLTLQHMIENGLADKNFLKKIFPRLKVWFMWINRTQVGSESFTYYWRGRDNKITTEVNPRTPSSGLDDFPRASHPNLKERHLDIRCWIALATDVLTYIAKKIKEDWHEYEATNQALIDNELLDKYHYSTKERIYSDYGFHADNITLNRTSKSRVILEEPKFQFINAYGYVSLFPLMLKIIDPHTTRLFEILSDLTKTNRLWTSFGLRSLSHDSPFYGKYNTINDPPYWRGSIWINMNYLVLRGLHYYSNVHGKNQKLALDIYCRLRTNIVSNVINQYYKKGYIYERYDDTTGEGQGCYPFSGWSALIVAIMSEKY
ncbi:mannosyl-oligosaccharide glucosidase-like [Mytilus edulis]|uniref:mannosyl-oligosaccharide glucosidase-like n=1 Tax=Mytilus edulis TaxID=6550 RepID=UPI0039F06EFA